MPHVIAWCGFFGAWPLVAGPLDQAVREVEDNEFERDAIAAASAQVEDRAEVAGWWLLLPPVCRWPRLVFRALVVVMLLGCVASTGARIHHRQTRPAVED